MRMEIAEREESTARQGATLLGRVTTRPPEHPQNSTKCTATKRRIITGVILTTLLAVILAVIFVLKLHCDLKDNSCRNRCLSGNRNSKSSCHCDAPCVQEGNCCLDYEEVCVEPSQLWTCSKFRCGEERLPSSLCSCAADCGQKGDCCTNYNSMCKGEKAWLEDECDDIKTPQCPESFSKPPLILISLDGFRAEYLKVYGGQLPTISKLRKCGTSTKYMRPAYPTKTFPNHYTIVTGLYPESHGIVDNKMYDVIHNATFSLKGNEKFNAFWYHGEPVWLTAMNNNLKSGTFFWPGSDVAIKGKFPNLHKKYNESIPFESRVMTIFEWLSLPQAERPDFYTLYLDEPDKSGHKYGPMSGEVFEALVRVDRIMQLVMDGLKQRKLHKCVNLVILSDHGMEEASCTKAAYVSSYQDNIEDFIVIQGPAARVRPKRLPEEFFTFKYEELVKNLSCRAPDQPMKPYLKEHLPKRLHFASNVRIERAHLYMKSQWQAALKPNEIKYCKGGFHGSDNVFRNMQTIFIGYGPGMKYNTTVAPFENIEVYNLLCDLLAIPPAPNNGTHGSLNHLLRNPPHHPVHPTEISSASICSTIVPSPNDDLGCCRFPNKSKEDYLNHHLISSNPVAKKLHLPYGVPRVLQENADYCVLQHSSYISGYSKDILMPLWVAYTLEPLSGVQLLSSSQEECVHADMRIPAEASQSCNYYKDHLNLTYGFLHPPNLASYGTESDSLITSNMAPMFTVFKGIWDYFHNVLVVKYSENLNGVNVMSGPIFDKDFDGKYDNMKLNTKYNASIPTHFFVILMSCKNLSVALQKCDSPIETVSFILPHRPDNIETCHNGSEYSWVQDWTQLHVARIRDIELLTGLSFYPDLLPVEDALQLKTFLKSF
ncbi:ectonucleotide pyrophosphatase/phosphodiesterase family member 1 isoform X1 [Ictalurus furcatus]|uniref:ectonucleotide pyrophosphatase/phosphodiesterase family member 1 isoform X1 n=1 Tax=Ictalurus furcatus TaxID=66913 RepID=UPI00234FC00B|nr:ectonucleotide pyrophosphatase/phosphodiesterase family member 1 isoform X1 [Ictalurus furcatus]